MFKSGIPNMQQMMKQVHKDARKMNQFQAEDDASTFKSITARELLKW